MLLALDFDGVISEDKDMWATFIRNAKDSGHDVCIVTQNFPDDRDDIREFAESVDVPVFYAGDHKKNEYMTTMVGREPDVVVDDNLSSWVSGPWA